MTWINTLHKTYEMCIDHTDISKDAKLLHPLYHSTSNAQVEIMLDEEGNCIDAKPVEKEDAQTLIPVTEDSATRGNGVNPHPLCDKLFYVAGDYHDYVPDKKDRRKCFADYQKLLQAWSESPYSHWKVKAIHKYVEKKCIVKDLVRFGVFTLDEQGMLTKGTKVQQTEPKDLFVRFSVIRKAGRKDCHQTGKDKELVECYINYCRSMEEKTDTCYITGQQVRCAEKHPARILNSAITAKIISANDEGGFKYRGRFNDKSQAATAGYEASQMAHSALRWLIEKQGYVRGGTAFVAWRVGENGDTDVVDILADTEVVLKKCQNRMAMDDWDEDDVPSHRYLTMEDFGKRFRAALFGASYDLERGDQKVVVMGIQQSGDGRIAISYYRELDHSELLNRVIAWHEGGVWYHRYKRNKNGAVYGFMGVPSPWDIANAAFGREEKGAGKANTVKLQADDETVNRTVQRLFACILEGRAIPKDLLRALVYRAGKPLALSAETWAQVLSTACSVIKKYRFDHYGEEWSMEENKKDRDYLFGELLAVADLLEYYSYDPDDARWETNAKRYWAAFQRNPAVTWETLHQKLRPYWRKLEEIEREEYLSRIRRIMCELEQQEGYSRLPLKENYLLGYWVQSDKLVTWRKENKKK